MRKQTIWLLVILVIVAAGALWYFQSGVMLPLGNSQSQTASTTPNGEQGAAQGSSGTVAGGGGSAAGPAASGGLKTYSNTGYGFTFQYPSSATLETTGLTGGFKEQGAVAAAGVFVRLGTVVERMTVSVSSEPADVGACTTQPGTSSTVTMDGQMFTKFMTSASVGGQITDTATYRILRNRTCYEVRDVITSAEVDKLSSQEVETQRANLAATMALMGSIRDTFRFTR